MHGQASARGTAWHLTFSRTLEAEYTPYASVITDGSGLPEILVDGSFSRSAKVAHTTADVTWTDESGKEHAGTAYTVTVTDPVLDDVSYTVHYRLPDHGKRYALWVETAEGWQRQHLTVDGSYAMIPCQERKITFCVQEEGPVWLVWAIGNVLFLLLFVTVATIQEEQKEQKRQKASGTGAGPGRKIREKHAPPGQSTAPGGAFFGIIWPLSGKMKSLKES